VRKAVALLNQADELTVEHFRAVDRALFHPQDTGVFTQLQYFQENKERLGIIVDEYGEVQGLVTLDDIIEEMIGDFTTSTPGTARADAIGWDAQGECLLEGSTPLRDINKKLGLDLPLDGPKTVNGLLLEQLQEIPEFPIALKVAMRDRSGAGAESVNQGGETVKAGCYQTVAGGLKLKRGSLGFCGKDGAGQAFLNNRSRNARLSACHPSNFRLRGMHASLPCPIALQM
jgi:hypothetical protein